MIYNQNEMINNQHKRRVITICLKQTLNLDYLYNTFERNDYLEMWDSILNRNPWFLNY